MSGSSTGYIHNTSQRNVSGFREALPQVFAVSVKNLVLIGFGMSVGFPTILIAGLEDENDMSVTIEEISWLGSINLIFVPIGCLLSGPISQKIGRKYTMLTANVLLIASWLLLRNSTEIWQLYLGLGIGGFLLGCIESSVITYVAEITTPKLRGILASTGSVSFIIGILLQFLLGTFVQWREAALLSIITPIVATNFLILLPKSPYWLLSRRQNSKAQLNLAWFRGWIPVEDVEAEYRNIYQDFNQTVRVNTSSNQVSKTVKFFKPFGIVAFAFFIRHFNGITNLQTYAVDFFMAFSTPFSKYHTTALLGVVEVFGCCVCVVFVHILGKRVLTFITLFLSGFCMIGAASYATINGFNEISLKNNDTSLIHNNTSVVLLKNYKQLISEDLIQINNWIPTGFLLGFAFFANSGIRILPWILAGELFPTEIRPCSVGISTATGYLLGFATNKIFFNIQKILTLPGILFAYALLCFVGILVLYFILPETEGKSLIEITQLFTKRNGVDLNANPNTNRVLSRAPSYGINFDLINSTNEGNTYKKFSDIEVPL